MIRRSPAEVYIKYLLSHTHGYTDAEVIDLLRLGHLDFLGTGYLQRLRAEMVVPIPFRPSDLTHRPSASFLRQQRIHYLYHPDAAMTRALELLGDPHTKELIESMIITDDPDELIVFRLTAIGKQADQKVVERYRFFFFNTTLVDSTELRALLNYRVDFSDPEDDPYEQQMRRSLQKAQKRDPRVLAAQQPTKPVASLLNQMRMGFMPEKLQLGTLVEATRVAALAQANTAAHVGGVAGATETQGFVLAAKMLTELLQDIGSADTDLTRELQTLALKTESRPLPYIAELSGGEHTVEVMPSVERDKAYVE